MTCECGEEGFGFGGDEGGGVDVVDEDVEFTGRGGEDVLDSGELGFGCGASLRYGGGVEDGFDR